MRLFQKSTIEDKAKDAKKVVTHAQRDIARDVSQLSREEAKLVADIKAAGARGNQAEMRSLAKQLVQIRNAKARLGGASAQLTSVKTAATMAKANASMAKAMESTTKAMTGLTKKMDPAATAKQMAEFERSMAGMQMTEEMMDDALADAFDTEEGDEEVEAMTQRILDELALGSAAGLSAAPTRSLAAGGLAEEEEAAGGQEQIAMGAKSR